MFGFEGGVEVEQELEIPTRKLDNWLPELPPFPEQEFLFCPSGIRGTS